MAAEHYEVPPSLQRVSWLNGQHLKPMQGFEALTNKLGWDYNYHRPQVVWQRGCEVRLEAAKVRRVRGHASHHHPVRGPGTVTTTVQMGTYLTFYLERGCSSVARCSLVLDGVQDVHGRVPRGHHDEHGALRTRILVTRVDTGRVHPMDDEQPGISTETATPTARTSTAATDHNNAASMDKVDESPPVAASVRTLSRIRSKQRRKLQKNSKNSSKWTKNLRQSQSEKPSGSITKKTNAYKDVHETSTKNENIPTSKTCKFYTSTPATSAQVQIKKNYESVLDYTSVQTISSTCVIINTPNASQYSPHENISNSSLNTRDKEQSLTSYNAPGCPETLDPPCHPASTADARACEHHSRHTCTTTPAPEAGTDLATTAAGHVSDWSVEVDLSCHDEVTTVLSDDSGEDEWEDDDDEDIQKVVRKCVTVDITGLLRLPSAHQANQGHREQCHNTHATPSPVMHNTMQRNCTLQTEDGATERIAMDRITNGEHSKGKECETAIECLYNERNKEVVNISCEKGICPRYQKPAPSSSSNNNNSLLLPLQQSLLSSLDKQCVDLLCSNSTPKLRNDKNMNIKNYSMNPSINIVSKTNHQADNVVKQDRLRQEISKKKSIFYTESSVNKRAPAQQTVAPESSTPPSVTPSGSDQGRELRPEHFPSSSRDRHEVKDRDLTPDRRGELLVLLLQPRAPQQAWQFQTAYVMVWYSDSGGPDGGSKSGTTSRRLKRTHLNCRRTAPCRAGVAGASAHHDDSVTTLLTTTAAPTIRHDDTTMSDALPANEGTQVTIYDRIPTVKHASPSLPGAPSTERESLFSVRDTASLLVINSPPTTSSALTHFNAIRNKINNLKRGTNVVGVNS